MVEYNYLKLIDLLSDCERIIAPEIIGARSCTDLNDFINNIAETLFVEYCVREHKYELTAYMGGISRLRKESASAYLIDSITGQHEEEFATLLKKSYSESVSSVFVFGDSLSQLALEIVVSAINTSNSEQKLFFSIKDVSNAVKQNSIISELRENYFNSINYTKCALCVFDDKLKITNANAKALALFGLSFDEITKLKFSELLAESESKTPYEAIKYLKRGNNYFKYAKFNIGKNVVAAELNIYKIRINSQTAYSATFIEVKDCIDIQKPNSVLEQRINNLISENNSLRMQIVEHKKQEEQSREVFDKMNIGYALHRIILNSEGRAIDYVFLDVNAGFTNLTGLRLGEIVNRRVMEVLPDTEPIWIERYGEVAITGKSISFSHYSAEFDKTYSVYAFRPRENHFCTIFNDVTEFIAVQRLLQENEQRYKAVMDNSLIGIWQISASGETMYVNQQMIKELNLKINNKLADFKYSKYFSPKSLEWINDCFKSSDSVGYNNNQLEIICEDNQHKTMLASITVNQNDAGEIESITCFFADITNQTKYRNALAYSEKKFRIISDYANNWEIYLDSDGSVAYSNPYSEKLLGVPESELEFFHFSDIYKFVHPDDLASVKECFVSLLGRANISDLQFKLKHSERGYLDASLSSQPVVTDDDFVGIRISISDISQLKEIERINFDNQHKYKVYVEHAPYGLFILNRDMQFVEINKKAVEITKYSREEILNFTPYDTITDGTRAVLDSFVSELKEQGLASAVLDSILKDGSTATLQVDGVRINDNEYLTFVQDITQAYKAQRKLIDTESNLRAILNNNQEAIVLVDLEYKVIEFNSNCKALFAKVLRSEVKIGMSLENVMSQRNREYLIANFQACFDGKSTVMEKEYISPFDEKFYFHVSFKPLIKEDKIAGASLSLLDVTLRKRMEMDLINSKMQYELLVDNIHDLVSLIDKDGKFTYVNKQYTNTLGYAPAELIGNSPLELVHPDDLNFMLNRIKEQKAKKLFNSVDIYSLRHKNGNYLTFENKSTMYRNISGESLMVVVARDITVEIESRRAILNSEAEMRLLMDGIPIMIAHLSMDLDVLFANRAFCKFFLNSEEYKYILNLKRIIKDSFIDLIVNSKESALAGILQVIEGTTHNALQEAAALNAILISNSEAKADSLYFIANDITEQLKNEAAVKYQTEFNSTLLQTVGAMIIALDSHGKIIIFNSEAERVTGFSAEKVLHRFYFDYFVDEDEVLAFANSLNIINETRKPLKFNDYILNSMRERRIVEWTNTIMTEDGADGYYIICTGIDVTDIKKSERTVESVSLVVSEFIGDEFFNKLVLKINEIIDADFTLIGEIVDNRMIRSLALCDRTKNLGTLEYELDKTPTRRAIENAVYIYPEHVTDYFPDDEFLVRNNIDGYICLPLYSSYQRPIAVMVALFKKKIQNPNAVEHIMRIFAVRTVAEIERLRSETELLLQEESFRAIAENIPDIIMRFNSELEFLYASSGIFELTGIDSDEIVGKSIDKMLFDDELKEIWKSDILHVFNDSLIVERIFSIDTDGITAYYDWRLIPEYNSSGDTVTVLALARDYTKQILDEQELIKAKEEAEISDKLKSAFLANMSHELRTPLNAIIGFSNLLKFPDLEDEERLEYINIISERGNDLLKLISDIIDLSKIESGSVAFTPSRFSVNDFLYTAYEEYSKLAEKKFHKSIQHRLSIPNKTVDLWVNTDKLKLRQIINNLYENAMKFTNEGYVEIGYSTVSGGIELFVKDSGIGIPEEKQAIVFERFRQADDSHNKLFGGAGLGLSIAKKLVDMFGGNVRCESKVNQGTAFYVNLPLEYETKIDEGREAYLQETEIGIDLHNRTILVAEDDVSNYQFLEKLLRHYGAEVLRAENGRIAIEMVADNPQISVIFMDIQMPEMNGYEAAKEIKLLRNDIPMIATTALTLNSENEHELDDMFVAHLPKPIIIHELESILNKIFAGDNENMPNP